MIVSNCQTVKLLDGMLVYANGNGWLAYLLATLGRKSRDWPTGGGHKSPLNNLKSKGEGREQFNGTLGQHICRRHFIEGHRCTKSIINGKLDSCRWIIPSINSSREKQVRVILSPLIERCAAKTYLAMTRHHRRSVVIVRRDQQTTPLSWATSTGLLAVMYTKSLLPT